MPAHVDASYILKKPLLSEKSTWAMNEQNRYAFIVDARASKDEIRAAVEKIYKVRVEGVSTQRKKHKEKRFRTGVVIPADTKKAIVKLHKDDKLELFEPATALIAPILLHFRSDDSVDHGQRGISPGVPDGESHGSEQGGEHQVVGHPARRREEEVGERSERHAHESRPRLTLGRHAGRCTAAADLERQSGRLLARP